VQGRSTVKIHSIEDAWRAASRGNLRACTRCPCCCWAAQNGRCILRGGVTVTGPGSDAAVGGSTSGTCWWARLFVGLALALHAAVGGSNKWHCWWRDCHLVLALMLLLVAVQVALLVGADLLLVLALHAAVGSAAGTGGVSVRSGTALGVSHWVHPPQQEQQMQTPGLRILAALGTSCCHTRRWAAGWHHCCQHRGSGSTGTTGCHTRRWQHCGTTVATQGSGSTGTSCCHRKLLAAVTLTAATGSFWQQLTPLPARGSSGSSGTTGRS